jgi:hypothetical protein
VVAREPRGAPAGEAPGGQRLARLAHERHQEGEVVQREQPLPELLAGGEEVAHVRAVVARAARARAPLDERAPVAAEAAAPDLHLAVGG